MKRFLLLMILCLLLPCAALTEAAEGTAEELAEDITTQCLINNRPYNSANPDAFCDNDYGSFYTGRTLTIAAPEGKVIGGLQLMWRTIHMPGVIISTQVDGEWVEVLRDGPNYAAQYIVLPEGVSTVRISAQSGKMELSEVIVLTPGKAPDYVQIWRDPPETVDLMLFTAHPDDEVLWFGGLLPRYAGEEGRDVLVVNAVYAHYFRRLELLKSLWTCGVDIYPVMLGYLNSQESVAEVMSAWSTRGRRPKDEVVELIRRYKPDVVVLHDAQGEYGHPAHIAFCQLGQQGVERAADPAQHPASAQAWGVWDVPKTYIHLWGENQLRLDWNVPLTAFGGRTGLEVAAEGFACHISQQGRNWNVVEGGKWDNALFGLWRTTVGLDVEKNDLFENIPAQ